MNDQISRQKLIEELNTTTEHGFYGEFMDGSEVAYTLRELMQIIESQSPADQWIPCIVKLPEKSGEYWVTIIWSNKPTTSTGRYDAEKKTWDRYSYDPIAWKPYTYPEPYKGV